MSFMSSVSPLISDARLRHCKSRGHVSAGRTSRPFTNTSVCHILPVLESREGLRRNRCALLRRLKTLCAAIGATFVKCQSSFFIVGKPTDSKVVDRDSAHRAKPRRLAR